MPGAAIKAPVIFMRRLENKMKKGFTLTELLAVVLIIGVLAAVALPQYRTAVGRARAAEAKTALSALSRAAYIAYMETAEHPQIDALSVKTPDSKQWAYIINECCTADGFYGCSFQATYLNGTARIYLIDHDYEWACGDRPSSQMPKWNGFTCRGEECPRMGFVKYIEEGGLFREP